VVKLGIRRRFVGGVILSWFGWMLVYVGVGCDVESGMWMRPDVVVADEVHKDMAGRVWRKIGGKSKSKIQIPNPNLEQSQP